MDVLGLGPEGNVSGGGRIVVGVWCVVVWLCLLVWAGGGGGWAGVVPC